MQFTTSKPETYVGRKPVIKKVEFRERGRISVVLEDGRVISAPLSNFPSIRKLNEAQRKQYIIGNDDTIIFHHCNEIYHIQDFFGLPEDYILKP